MASQILGNVIGTFILGKISNMIYFIVLGILGGKSVITQYPEQHCSFSSDQPGRSKKEKTRAKCP